MASKKKAEKLPVKQEDWTADETGEPVPVTQPAPEPEQAWASETAEQADWDASNVEKVDLTEEQVSEALDDWNTAANVTLNIETHTGAFNPEQVKMLIYGETGMQKTRLASTFPHVIFADIDHGMSSVTEQVDKIYVHDNDQGFDELKSLYKFLAEGGHEYETVVLDTLNEMQRVIMRFTIEEYTHIKRSYGNLPGQSDYGKMLYEFLELTRDFIALPMRVVLLAQVNSRVFDTDTLMPQLVGKNSAREILRKMDVVGYIYRQDGAGDKKVPVISFDSVEYVTKDRSNKLPAALINPSFARIASYWK